MSDEELFPLFEAARWAPVVFNGRPWRFIVGRRQNPDEFAVLVDLLIPGKRVWAQNAGVLIVVASRTRFEYNDQPAITHAFDAGAAWENLAIEASRRGFVAHGMQGFDYERAKVVLSIPDGFDVHAMIAIGHRAPADSLPKKYRAMEQPNGRRPLHEIVFEGGAVNRLQDCVRWLTSDTVRQPCLTEALR